VKGRQDEKRRKGRKGRETSMRENTSISNLEGKGGLSW